MKKAVFFIIFILLVYIFPLAAQQPTLTVLDFQTNNVSKGDMNSILLFLSAALHDTGSFRVIDSAQRDTILKEPEFSNSGCTDESCQLEIGKLLSAEYIVTGDIGLLGNKYTLSARMLETETSVTASTARGIYESLDDLSVDMSDFAVRLSGEKQAQISESDTMEASTQEAGGAEASEPEMHEATAEQATIWHSGGTTATEPSIRLLTVGAG